jgi:hypothetical protein
MDSKPNATQRAVVMKFEDVLFEVWMQGYADGVAAILAGAVKLPGDVANAEGDKWAKAVAADPQLREAITAAMRRHVDSMGAAVMAAKAKEN